MTREKINQYSYYIVIAIISLVVLVFMPLIGSQVSASIELPQTPIEWSIFITTKVITAILNVLIFHSFIQQGKLNVKSDPRYLEAEQLLGEARKHTYKPKSPKKFFSREYATKGISIFVFSALSTVVISEAILTYDWISLISYTITLCLGVIWGILEMKKVEAYLVEEYLDYAKLTKENKQCHSNTKD